MDFKELYRLVEENLPPIDKTAKSVGFEFLRQRIQNSTNDVQEVCIWRLVYNPARGDAHFMLFDDRSSAYNGEYLVADISYCSSLEQDPPELLFALTKELMHVFDPEETRIDTRAKFVKFLKDLQNTPLDQKNGALNMEHQARWMALLVLCPKPIRDFVADEVSTGQALKVEIAQRLGLPEWAVELALDSYYDEAHQILTA